MARKQVSQLCRVCTDRVGMITCPVCHAKHCDGEDCSKDCKTCSDCYHPNCKDCGTWIDPRDRIQREISTIDSTLDALRKRTLELLKEKEVLVYRLQGHERRLARAK